MKILLIEDNEQIRKMLNRKFRKTDWEIHEAENGQVGVEAAFKLQPDLILMDMHMPVMDGHEATRFLRANKYRGKIAALTASVMHSDNKEALKDGCDYFIQKPIAKDFLSQIKDILDRPNEHKDE
ncbi:response regulator [bacterium]|nr:response regulator [bacterium]